MEYLGALPAWGYEDKEAQLFDDNCYHGDRGGIMGLHYGHPPDECVDFCLSQYARFGIPTPLDVQEVVMNAASISLYYVDVWDPYALFNASSDVEGSLDWSTHAYEIVYHDHPPFEADPNSLETFVFVPGQAERTFYDILSKPSLDALGFVAAELKDLIYDNILFDASGDIISSLPEQTQRAFREICTVDGTYYPNMATSFIELGVWAAYAWIVGPPSLEFRMRHHEVISTAVRYGEAVIYEWEVINPKHYKKLPRPPMSCYVCGVAAWCVEHTIDGGGARCICEHCATVGMPKSKLATCGKKRCLLTQCRHHPYHNMGAAGIRSTQRGMGQLHGFGKDRSTPFVEGKGGGYRQLT